MRKGKRAAQARRALDRKFATAHLEPVLARPHGGWIRAIRTGLGMSQEVLARRLGVAPPTVTKLERSEVRDTISIGKLAEVADALDCRLVYALVPNSTLQQSVDAQARRAAARLLGYVDMTMVLEDQAIESGAREDQLALQAARLIDDNTLWREG